jgi:hypothetical protein
LWGVGVDEGVGCGYRGSTAGVPVLRRRLFARQLFFSGLFSEIISHAI